MNTPDTEWEERFNEVYPSVTVGYDGSEMDARRRAKVWQFIEDEITTLNARHHTALTSRDTYWKERVEELIEKTIQEERFSGAPYALNKLKETITNKDNLK